MFIASAAGSAVGAAARATRRAVTGTIKATTNVVKGAASAVKTGVKNAATAVATQASKQGNTASTTPTTMESGGADTQPPMHGNTGEDIANEMYPDLKRCLCDSLAKMFTDTSPALVKIVLESVEGTIATDDGIKTYIQQRIRNIAGEVLKEQQTKDLIVQSLTDNCNTNQNNLANNANMNSWPNNTYKTNWMGGQRRTQRNRPRNIRKVGGKPFTKHIKFRKEFQSSDHKKNVPVLRPPTWSTA
jgi:hypothetical protein